MAARPPLKQSGNGSEYDPIFLGAALEFAGNARMPARSAAGAG
jgi:hypothetical protein